MNNMMNSLFADPFQMGGFGGFGGFQNHALMPIQRGGLQMQPYAGSQINRLLGGSHLILTNNYIHANLQVITYSKKASILICVVIYDGTIKK